MIYAVIENNIVTNIILANSKEIAEQITEKTCIEINNEPGSPGIGWSYINGVFIEPVKINEEQPE